MVGVNPQHTLHPLYTLGQMGHVLTSSGVFTNGILFLTGNDRGRNV